MATGCVAAASFLQVSQSYLMTSNELINHKFSMGKCYDIEVSFFPAVVLRGIPYKNNSNVTLEDIGEGLDALLCITNYTACCSSHTGGTMGDWFFPNGTRVPSSGNQWDFYRDRGQMVVRLHHRRGGEEGIYRCEIPDAMNTKQTIYIGVYSANTGEWYMLKHNYRSKLGTILYTVEPLYNGHPWGPKFCPL